MPLSNHFEVCMRWMRRRFIAVTCSTQMMTWSYRCLDSSLPSVGFSGWHCWCWNPNSRDPCGCQGTLLGDSCDGPGWHCFLKCFSRAGFSNSCFRYTGNYWKMLVCCWLRVFWWEVFGYSGRGSHYSGAFDLEGRVGKRTQRIAKAAHLKPKSDWGCMPCRMTLLTQKKTGHGVGRVIEAVWRLWVTEVACNVCIGTSRSLGRE